MKVASRSHAFKSKQTREEQIGKLDLLSAELLSSLRRLALQDAASTSSKSHCRPSVALNAVRAWEDMEAKPLLLLLCAG